MPKTVRIKDLVRDPRLQSRAKGLDDDHVADIIKSIENHEGIDPIKVCVDPNGKYCYDGWHRIAAYERKGFVDIPAETESGGIEDAIERAASANQTHGLKRTNDDKRRAVELLLALKAWSDKSDRAIADQAGVGNHLVSDVRAAQVGDSPTCQEPKKRKGKDGKSYTVKAKPKKPKATKDEPPRTDTADGSASSDSSPVVNGIGKHEDVVELPAGDPNAETCGKLRSLSVRINSKFTEIKALAEELGLLCQTTKYAKLRGSASLTASLDSAARSCKAVAAAVRDSVSAGECSTCKGKGGACRDCNGDGFQSVEERRDAFNRSAAGVSRGAPA